MLLWIKDLLTTDTAQWYETMPFAVGFVFMMIELAARFARGTQPLFSAPALGYMLSEGITVCIMPMYGFALAFDRTLATAIADKNGKVLVVAMFVAFVTVSIHLFNRWFALDEES